MEKIDSVTAVVNGVIDMPDGWDPKVQVTPNGNVIARVSEDVVLRWRSVSSAEDLGDTFIKDVVLLKSHVRGQCSTDDISDEAVGA